MGTKYHTSYEKAVVGIVAAVGAASETKSNGCLKNQYVVDISSNFSVRRDRRVPK